MLAFLPSSKREGRGKQKRGKMWGGAGLEVVCHAGAVWDFPLHRSCFPTKCPEPELPCYRVKY